MSEDNERINPDENWKAASTRSRVILALAQADGQPWADLAEATEHTAELMYGKQADAVLDLLGVAGYAAVGVTAQAGDEANDRSIDAAFTQFCRITDALGVASPRRWHRRDPARITNDYILPGIERLRAES